MTRANKLENDTRDLANLSKFGPQAHDGDTMSKFLAFFAVLALLLVGCQQAPGTANCIRKDGALTTIKVNETCPEGSLKPADLLSRVDAVVAANANQSGNTAKPTAVPVATAAAGSTPAATPPITATATVTVTAPITGTNTVAGGMGSKGSPPYMGGNPTTWTQLHHDRLTLLDVIYKDQGLDAVLKAAGITWDGKLVDARQPQEDTWAVNDTKNTSMFSGIQVTVQNMVVRYPNAVTTNVSSRITPMADAMSVTADERTGSKVWTNVVANGPVTVYVSVYSWGQFPGRFGMLKVDEILNVPTTATAAATTPTTGGLTKADVQKFATVISTQQDKGIDAGWQVTLTADWTLPESVDVFEVNTVQNRPDGGKTTFKAGTTGTIWMKPAFRPVK